MHPYAIIRFLPPLAVLLLLCVSACTPEAQMVSETNYRLLYADQEHMAAMKARYLSGDTPVVLEVDRLILEAIPLMTAGPFSVMDKTQIPPSGDKHDYMSQGPYWWPDTTKPDGLPYIRRDGQVNPERDLLTDHRNFDQVMNLSLLFSRAYYFTGKEIYAERTAELLRVWFLDEATRMNPNLEYGQAIPGITEGRGIGIIETANLGKITDAITMLRDSPNWTSELEAGMQNWMRAYLNWLLTSDHGRDESVHPNNHGTWYDVQTSALALFTGQDSLARSILEAARVTRMDEDIEADGAQPKELARTRSYDYSRMNLQGLFYLARLGDFVGVNLWHHRTPGGATLRTALDYLLPASLQGAPWPHEQIRPIDPTGLIPHLLIAAGQYDPEYAHDALALMEQEEKPKPHVLFWPIPEHEH